MKPKCILFILMALLALAGCQADETEPLPPDEYLENALNWIEAHAIKADSINCLNLAQNN